MGKKWISIIASLCLASVFAILCLPAEAYAHGAEIEYAFNTSIEIVAKYDSGEPMSGAQVTVYAPSDPATPWLTGVCDDEGRFAFTPDASDAGTWDVQVRLAGHGDIVHIPIGEDTVAAGGSSGYSVLQIVLMSICVIWGLIGTALYVSRRRA
ncbi:MAG: carboxypeptidase-like regulatory domain-containing protein [Chloroflexota bacterium]|nr:carboxypeptidase-like regulatory domain-containing protein [Chloroflexota bacterium]